MNNHETAKAFANGTKARGKNGTGSLWFEKDVIYSYGTHWPLAIVYRNADGDIERAYVNTDKYGITTSRHLSIVRYALHKASITDITFYDCETMQAFAKQSHFDFVR